LRTAIPFKPLALCWCGRVRLRIFGSLGKIGDSAALQKQDGGAIEHCNLRGLMTCT